MASKKKKADPTVPAAPPAKMGRPEIPFDPNYCEQLIQHMAQGGSFESFGSVPRCGKDLLYSWLKKHPEFSDSRKIGVSLSAKFYEDLGKMIATGNLRRLKSERPMMTKDKEGRDVPVIDPTTGQVMYHREYEPAHANATAWIFMMKNMHGWRDKRDVLVTGDPDNPIHVKGSELSPTEKLKEIQEMQKFLTEIEDDNADAIETTATRT